MGCSCTIITTIDLEGHDNKDLSSKAKARTNDYNFVLKDNQGPRPRITSLVLA